MTEKLRVRREERKLLKKLQHVEEVRREALERGLIDNWQQDMSYRMVLKIIIPDDADVIERPEEDMVWITAHDMKDEVLELAGENISAHHVVRKFVSDYIQEHDIDPEVEED